MTITYVGASKGDYNGTGQTSVTTESDISTQAGDVVFVFAKHEDTSGSITITDSVGGGTNTFTSRGHVDHSNGGLHTELFTSVLASGSTTHRFTATWAASKTYGFVGAVVYRSGSGFTYFDAISAQGSSSTPSAGSKTPTGPYAAVTGFGEYAAGTWTAGTNWTSTVTGTFAVSFMERRTNTTGETITGNASFSTSMDWTAQMAVFLENVPPPDLPPPYPQEPHSAYLALADTAAYDCSWMVNVAIIASTITPPVSGSFAANLSSFTMSAVGTVDNRGTFAATLDSFSMSASGSVGGAPDGTFATTLAPFVLASTGIVENPGAFSTTLGSVVMSASGVVLVTGAFASNLDGFTMAATGQAAANVSGTFASNLGSFTLAAIGFIGTPPAVTQTRPLVGIGT